MERGPGTFRNQALAAAMIVSTTMTARTDDRAVLVEAGKPRAVIVVQTDDPLQNPSGGNPAVESSVALAADDLARYIEQISGAQLPVRSVSAAEIDSVLTAIRGEGKTPILLGSPAAARLGSRTPAMDAALGDPSGFVRVTDPQHILLAASTPSAVGHGVSALLEDLGVRWFYPGPEGTVIPNAQDLALPAGVVAERPSLAARHFQLKDADEWIRRQRAGGLYFPSAHGIPLGKDASLETHPDFYALVGGKRTSRQLCLANPEVLRRAVEETKRHFRKNPDAPWIGMGPNDGSGFCECAGCRERDGGDKDPFSGGISVTDRYVDFFNEVLAGIQDEFPDKQVAFYIYHNYMRPPVRVKPDARIAGAIAPISLCRIHGMNNLVCPERSYLRTLIEEWKRVLPNLYERGYWYNLADPAMPFVQTHRLADEIPAYARQGVRGYRTECMGHWALQGPSLYLAGRLMWNADADPEAVVGDFCDKLFGPAAGPMKEYFDLLDARMRDGDHHAGSAFNALQFFPADVRAAAAAHLREAEKRATAEPWKSRVEGFADGFAYFETFAEMREATLAQDWARAETRLREMDSLTEKLGARPHPMLAVKSAQSHFNRFFRPCVEQGHARVTDGNTLAAACASEWDFLIDPKQTGEALGYFRPGVRGGNWQSLSSEVPWSDVGLGSYKGLAWYRQKVILPKDSDKRRVFLWFGGVDESARVWVNGKLLGTGPDSAFTPFELDATGAVRSGENTVAVCVANLKVNELGSGGITAPAFFYFPGLGDKAVLENLRPLRETFP